MKKTSSPPLFELPPERRWKQQLYPAPIVVGIIRREAMTAAPSPSPPHYLLIKRNGKPYNGCWALVGGKWEFGETLPAAILREVNEETGMEASFVAVRGIVSERVKPMSNEENGAHFLLFVCELIAGAVEAKEQEEGALAWFTRVEIDQLHENKAIIPSDYMMVKSFAAEDMAVAHIEAEMLAPIRSQNSADLQLLSFERIG